MTRWKAAGIHLAISVTIGLLVLALLFWVWYPGPYFDAAGGQHLVIVLLCVDLVLGPLLTLILFKSGKKGLLLDLWMIAVLQTGALVYGLYVISQSRPVFIVAAVDRFTVVAASEIRADDLAQGSKPEFRSLSWTGPRVIAARLPPLGKERDALISAELEGRSLEHTPRYFLDYEEEAANLLARAKPLSVLRASSTSNAPVVDGWLKSSGRAEADVLWLPVNARHAGLSMLVDARTGAVVDVLELDPW